MIYKSVCEEYIENSIDSKLRNELYNPLYNLSAFLGDVNGKVSKQTSSEIVGNLTITNPGVVMQGALIVELLKAPDIGLIEQDDFIPTVSYEAYKIYEKITRGDIGMVSQTPKDSPLLEFEKNKILITEHRMAMCSIYLDVFSVYEILINMTDDIKVVRLTKIDLNRILNNVRCVSRFMESFENPPHTYIKILRDLYKTIAYVGTLGFMYEEQYEHKIRGYREMIGGL